LTIPFSYPVHFDKQGSVVRTAGQIQVAEDRMPCLRCGESSLMAIQRRMRLQAFLIEEAALLAS
jgi:ribosomal protein S27AE